MLDYMLKQFSDLPWPTTVLQENLQSYINQQVSYCSDPEFASRFPYHQLELPKSFFHQVIMDIDGISYLTGPRFKDDDITQPYVDIVASNGPLTQNAVNEILRYWAPLKAKKLRILRQPDPQGVGEIQRWFYAAGIDQVMNEGNEDAVASLVQASASDLTWCLWAVSESHSQALRDIPRLRGTLQRTDEEVLSDYISHGYVWIIMSNGEKAGLICCVPGTTLFLPGWWIEEEVVVPRYRGHYLAAEVQKLLLKQITDNDPQSLLLGTIAAENLPSLKTAERSGRQVILEYAFVTEQDFS
ncbi:hypothetical protein [Vibrio nitrifigilis]|uniref:N-acetyltransferase domain-containing protein n=1 Tax=Vibrio nitrifigilis TaxID=2789781 RepID=A0ABS0GCQ9_9VIBR|nr:hypothetical protein [Vibrio nitrifigilis]MBF9000145.1 hypothetical protein [Vibrio nitrifigilis]